MARFKSSYEVVMRGMKGCEYTSMERNFDFVCMSALNALDAMKSIDRMEVGDRLYFSAASVVGYITHETWKEAWEWAESTHPSQNPAAYSVLRVRGCYKVYELKNDKRGY